MKKFIPLFIVAVMVSAAFSPLGGFRADAQQNPPQSVEDIYNLNNTPVTPVQDQVNAPNPFGDVGQQIQQSNTQGGKAAAAGNQGAPNKGPETAGCVKTIGGTIPYGFDFEACTASIVYLIMWIFSWVLWVAGKILDMSIYYTLNLSDLMTNVPVVDIGWRIFRDLANIFFIFILLWVAIGTILGLVAGKTKEMLVNLIVVALLMNFSLFITKAVIDGSNIVALHFYNLIVTDNRTPDGNWEQSAISAVTPTSSFSGAFMEGLKIQSIYQPQTGGNITNFVYDQIGQGINFFKIILIGLFGIILMMTAAYVFFVAAILFIIRVVVLMMVMMLSPLGFLAFALPATEPYADMWREKLISQSLFAPIYLALCFVVVKTIQTDAFRMGVMSVNSQDTAASAASTVASAAALFGIGSGGENSVAGFAFVFNFILLIGLMLGSILVAKRMEAAGVETAIELGKSARGFVGRSIMRGRYLSAGGTVAGGAAQVAGYTLAKTRIPGLKQIGDKIYGFGKKTAELGEKGQKKMDVNELDRKFGQTAFGKSSVGEFIREKTTGALTKATFGGEKTVKESYEEDIKRRGELGEIEKKNTALKLEEDLKKINPITNKKDYEEAKANLATAVNFISPQGFAEMNEKDIHRLAEYASLAQIDAAMKSTEWTLDEKREILAPKFKKYVDEFKELDAKSETYEKDRLAFEQLQTSGKIKIDGKDGSIVDDPSQSQVINKITGEVEVTNSSGGVDKYKIPSPPKLPSHLKAWARNDMTVHGYEVLYALMPNALKSKSLIGATRHGFTHKELRFNNNIGFNDRNELSMIKDAKIRRFVDPADPNYTAMNSESERVVAFNEAKTAAQALVTSIANATAEQKQKIWDEEWAKARSKHLQKDIIVEKGMKEWASGRSADEIATARGVFRNSPALHALVDKGIVPKWDGKDTEDIVFLVRDLVRSYKAEIEGKGVMTLENRKALEDILYNPRSRLQIPTLTESEIRKNIDDGGVPGSRGDVPDLEKLLKALRLKPQNSKLGSVIDTL